MKSPAGKPFQINARWVYLRSFLLVFAVGQIAVWHRLQRLAPRRGWAVFWLAPGASFRSLLVALLAGGVVTLAAVALFHLVLRPLLALWFNPLVDTGAGLFHLDADEKIVASVSARRRAGWGWHAGCLTVTTRRLWFFPARWNEEPWSIPLDDVDRIDEQSCVIAELPPIRNWPLPLRFWTRSGGPTVFAVADPAAVLAWFNRLEPATHDPLPQVLTTCNSGVFDG